MTGKMHSFQSLGTVDGPGVRNVVFLQGCALRCPYCHNPDTWALQAGTSIEAADLLQRVLRYKPYFGQEGGVTVSGGEPLLQAAFVTEFFTLCKAHGISTTLDTAGTRLDEDVLRLLQVTDILLLDLKFSTDAQYRQFIGIPLATVLRFLEAANERKIRIILRQVIVPGINDAPEQIQALGDIATQFAQVEKIELLPFAKLCAEKYETMGISLPFQSYPAASAQDIQRLTTYLPTQFTGA